MDGREFDWIRKQLGLSKVELARQFGIVVLAILGLSYQYRMGGLLEELSEAEEETMTKTKRRQGNRGAKSSNFCCKCNYKIHNLGPRFGEQATKERFLRNHHEPS